MEFVILAIVILAVVGVALALSVRVIQQQQLGIVSGWASSTARSTPVCT
jgi:regulator of protease activity HflC (stomatin/prohibitin superfamily)